MKRFKFLFFFIFPQMLIASGGVKNIDVLVSLQESSEYNRLKCGIENLDELWPGDTLATLRSDGKIVLSPVSAGDNAWVLTEEVLSEDHLRLIGAANMETVLSLNTLLEETLRAELDKFKTEHTAILKASLDRVNNNILHRQDLPTSGIIWILLIILSLYGVVRSADRYHPRNLNN